MFHAHHESHTLDAGKDIGCQLGVTPHDCYQGMGMLAVKAVYGMPALGICLAGHRTGVDNAEVGLLSVGGIRHTKCTKAVAQGGGLGIIEFTAQRHIGCPLII